MKPAIEWLNELGDTVASEIFAQSLTKRPPPGQSTLELIERIQNDAIGAHETAVQDRHVICQLGENLIGTGKQCYSADAVFRAVMERKDAEGCKCPQCKGKTIPRLCDECLYLAED
jgi:hypothetical protein